MTDTLQHDPRTKKQIQDALYNYLYGPVFKQFRARLGHIIIKNTLLQGASHKSFVYKGILYECDQTPAPRKSNRLIPQMVALMEAYLFDVREINQKEIPYVLGFINQVLNSTNELHDYLRMLPDAIHAPIDKLIATCPCRTKSLTDLVVQDIVQTNKESLNLLKYRLVRNLIT